MALPRGQFGIGRDEFGQKLAETLRAKDFRLLNFGCHIHPHEEIITAIQINIYMSPWYIEQYGNRTYIPTKG